MRSKIRNGELLKILLIAKFRELACPRVFSSTVLIFKAILPIVWPLLCVSKSQWYKNPTNQSKGKVNHHPPKGSKKLTGNQGLIKNQVKLEPINPIIIVSKKNRDNPF